ncbi:5-hydroxytryptamine receptor 2A [Merluccius polli]|uniref:5-hydroxytryptamine receptor 2A n=1 Tax=Merluccius polli TaxID=89951 RepID=A0AA47MHQ7_MERPO|nr:5-hydroxytryptamine receptor 2A [Merluccius polli]
MSTPCGGNLTELASTAVRAATMFPPWPRHADDPPARRQNLSSLACGGTDVATRGGNWSHFGTVEACSTSPSPSSQVAEAEEVEKNWAALLIVAVVAVTVTGNILVILAVSLERKLHNATNYFLMSLAVADMLLGVLVMPVSMVTVLYDYWWPLPPDLCPVWIYLDVLFSTASIMHLCAISLDRYIAIHNPLHHSRSNSRTKARVKILAVWTISAGISMPIPVLGLRDHSKVFRDGSCQLTDDSFVLIGSFVAFFVPLTIMVVTYALTIRALQNEVTLCLDHLVPRPKWSTTLTLGFLPQAAMTSDKLFRRSLCRKASAGSAGEGGVPGVRGSVSGGPPFGRRTIQSINNEQKASKVLGVVFFLFVVMWCPFFITNVLAVVCDPALCDPAILGGLLNVFVWIGYLSSAVNPLVYTLFNKTYRAAFRRYVRCRYRAQKKPLQLILVNTIPPLVFGDMRGLRNGMAHPGGGARKCSLPGLTEDKPQSDKSQRDGDESCV